MVLVFITNLELIALLIRFVLGSLLFAELSLLLELDLDLSLRAGPMFLFPEDILFSLPVCILGTGLFA